MAEHNKGGANTRSDVVTSGETGPRDDPDTKGTIDQLRQGLDDLRGSVASLAARVGEGAVTAGSQGLQQARQIAGDVAEEVTDQATASMAAIRSRVQDQSPAVIALAFFAGVVVGGLFAASSISQPQSWPDRRPSGRR